MASFLNSPAPQAVTTQSEPRVRSDADRQALTGPSDPALGGRGA